MKNKNEILFPITSSGKHPYTKEVIKMAEDSGILITEIASLMNCSQPYVSQLKSENSKAQAKLADLEPVIHQLSPELPGQSFHTHTVFNKATPIIPDDWEEQVFMSGLVAVTEQSELGRYPAGDDGFNVVVENHIAALEKLDDNCKPYEKSYLGIDFNEQVDQICRAKSKLKESLNTYLEEEASSSKIEKESLLNLQEFISSTVNNISGYIRNNSDIDGLIEDMVVDKLKHHFEWRTYKKDSTSWQQRSLVEACRLAAMTLNFAPLVKDAIDLRYGSEPNPLETAEAEQVLASKEHAERLLHYMNNIIDKHDEKNEAKKYKFRLNKLCNSNASKQFKSAVMLEPSKPIAWESYGEALFGNMQRKVFETEALSHDVNLTSSFTEWAKELSYETEEEEIQICGVAILSTQIGACKLVIYELYTKQFIVLHTFTSKTLAREVTTLSDKLTVIELLNYVDSNSLHFGWKKNESETLSLELKSKLSEKGFRVPSIRSIY